MPNLFDKISNSLKSSQQDTKTLPPIRLTDPVDEFIENRVQITVSSVVSPPEENKSSSIVNENWVGNSVATDEHKIIRLDVRADHIAVEDQNMQFMEALILFENTLSPEHKTRFDLHGFHTWNEVIEEAKIAEMKYKKKGEESPFGKVRGWFRSLQGSASAVEGWTDLLPTESAYASTICGGFKMILRAAVRMGEIRDFAVKALATIPDEITKAQIIIAIHKDLQTSERLYDCVTKLYVTILEILDHLIHWYKRRSVSRNLKAFIQQGSYEKTLQVKLDGFTEAVQNVKDEADICNYQLSQQTYTQVKFFRKESGQWNNELKEGMKDLRNMMECVFDLCHGSPFVNQNTGQFQDIRLYLAPKEKQRSISRLAFCDAVLRYEKSIPQQDLQSVMAMGMELTLKEQDRVVYVIEHQLLKDWLMSEQNSSLLIKGHSIRIDSSSSTMSFIAAHLIQSTRKTKRREIQCLYWFSGRHRNALRDADANIDGVMRSLIGQLVNLSSDFDLRFIKRRIAHAIREENDLRVLCDVFDELIYQLMRNIPGRFVIFCVIDFLACLENENKDSVLFLVRRLRRITEFGKEKGKTFKLLLTHDGGAFRGAAEFMADEILTVPEESGGDRMGFNKLMWNTKVGHTITSMKAK